jgi:hypothetical protein
MKAHWFAIRTKPGAQSMAATINDPDFPERRKGESNVERSLRQRDIDVYMPAHWIEYQNRRTHKVTTRRLPLLVGYAFVHIDPAQFERVRLTDGVLSFLRMSMDTGPQRFAETEISKLMIDEFEAAQKAALEKHLRDEDIRLGRVQELTKTLKRTLPKGRASRINLRAYADIAIGKMHGPAKERVLNIIADLDKLTVDPIETREAA